MPLFHVKVTATLVLDPQNDRRTQQLALIESWCEEPGHGRRVEDMSGEGVVVSEGFGLTAPSHSDAQRIALRSFGVNAFEASLPPGPRRLIVDLALSD